jgi:transcriptional regulator with XRE-family HTH domain
LLQSKVEIQKLLGKNIANARKAKKLTQIALGDLLDLERQSINRIEKGGTNITVYLLIRIAKCLEIKPEILLDFVK